MSYKIGDTVTVDTCGGRWTNKITGISKDYDNTVIYHTSGDSLTSTTSKFLNVKGKQVCSIEKCCFKNSCKIKKVNK